jgi:16S rRNA (guanine1207-N2)-methyltransferase
LLIQIYYGLASNGRLFIAGSNREGIQSVLKDARDVFSAGRVLAYRKGNRISQFSAAIHEAELPGWATNPGISPGSWVVFPVETQSQTINIHSLPGIFSYDHLDEGTRSLLDVIEIPPGARVLDAGCGYGVIGITAALLGAGKVDLIDNNLLAIAASQETIRVNHVNNCTAMAGDLLEPLTPLQYDLVLSNPPFHAGHAVEYQMVRSIIAQSYLTLMPGGQLVVVANRFIRYERMIKDIFGNCTILKESNKFHVLCGLKS